jgi:hypothetical protein
VRLFNFLAREIPHIFLRLGIYVSRESLLDFLADGTPAFFERLEDVRCNGEAVSPVRLAEAVAACGTETVHLQDVDVQT